MIQGRPFDEWTVLAYLNTELICYSDPHCIHKIDILGIIGIFRFLLPLGYLHFYKIGPIIEKNVKNSSLWKFYEIFLVLFNLFL